MKEAQKLSLLVVTQLLMDLDFQNEGASVVNGSSKTYVLGSSKISNNAVQLCRYRSLPK